jgi:predicted membrane protein (TIGR00267 family)
MDLRAWRRRIREYNEITNLGPILRRYFVTASFDGALTILGVISAALAFGASDSDKPLIISSSIGAGIALAVSSAVGAFEVERVEKKLDIRTIERAMLARLSEEHRGAFRFATIVSAFVHGLAPVLAASLAILPFFFLDFRSAAIAAIAIILSFLFSIGLYLGSLVPERILLTGLRFTAAGVGTAVLLWLLGAPVV